MPEIESPPPSGDATGAPADWIQHDLHPAEEGWFIVALWPGVDLDDTALDVGYVTRHARGYLYLVGRIDRLCGLDGALYIRLPRPIHLPF